MFNMKRIAAMICLACLPFMVGATSASATGETISLKTTVVPKGKVYKKRSVPGRMQLSVKVDTPASATRVLPLKRAVVRFPRDLSFNPNNRLTPVCSDKKLSVRSNLAAGIAGVAKLCPKSIIGTGTAEIYLGKNKSPQTLIKDPQLLIFNNGKSKKGAKIKIYAFSQTTSVGILMYGTMSKASVINVAIPVLASDSATASFVLSIPGPPIKDSGKTFKGRDPRYARIKCSKGKWVSSGTFSLGERTYPGGEPTGPTTTVKAPPTTVKCKGARG